MSPVVVALDDVPSADDNDLGSDVPAGAVPCPECGNYYKSRGLTRHMVQAHGMEPPSRSGVAPDKGKSTVKLAQRWAEFQRGAALLISFACVQCAAAIVEDAAQDGEAIASFCENRPKLKKQVEQALSGMDLMILVGALGGTARKCMSHHEIGKKIGLAGPHTHTMERGSPEEQVMSFLTSIPEVDRNQLLNQVFSGMAATKAAASAPAAAAPSVTVVMEDENVPGQPPVVVPDDLTETDKFHMAMAHSGSGDFDTTL